MLATTLACGLFGPPDLNRVFAVEITTPDSLEEYDTLVPHARLLDGRGDSVPGAVFVWATLDTAALIVLDSITGRTVVNHAGQTGRLVVRSTNVTTDAIPIRTLAAADTLFATGTTADTARLSIDSISDSLKVELADTVKSASGGDSLVALVGRPVVYSITLPATAGPATLITADTAHSLVTTRTDATGTSGIAFVKVRLLGPSVPDSVVVQARARRAVGTTVPGSPVTFVVRFRP